MDKRKVVTRLGEDVKEQIIRATLEAMNDMGIQKVTTREIAKRAGVNSAALHYYFGTKELLVQAAMSHMSKRWSDAFDMLQLGGLSPNAKLLAFLHAFVNQAVEYPGITKSVLASGGKGGPIPSEATQNMGHGNKLLRDLIRELYPEASEKTITFMVIQLLSSAMYPMLLREQLVKIGSLDYFDHDTRDEYFRFILERQLGDLDNK